MREASRFLTAIILGLAAASFSSASAGPAVPEAAMPDYRDPLSTVRAEQPEIGTAAPISLPGDAAAEDVPGFTVIGTRPAGGLDSPEPEGELRPATAFAPTPTEDGSIFQEEAVGGQGASISGIARSLLNTVPGTGSRRAETDRDGRRPGRGNETNDIVSFIDDTVTELVTELLNPEITTEGLVTFSIAGFGNFALMVTEETGSIFLFDFDSGTAVKVYQERQSGPSRRLSSQGAHSTGASTSAAAGGKSNTFQRVLDLLQRNVMPIVTSPITLAAFALFAILWLVWRISAARD